MFNIQVFHFINAISNEHSCGYVFSWTRPDNGEWNQHTDTNAFDEMASLQSLSVEDVLEAAFDPIYWREDMREAFLFLVNNKQSITIGDKEHNWNSIQTTIEKVQERLERYLDEMDLLLYGTSRIIVNGTILPSSMPLTKL